MRDASALMHECGVLESAAVVRERLLWILRLVGATRSPRALVSFPLHDNRGDEEN